MLRNRQRPEGWPPPCRLLNEVLSLNAQESGYVLLSLVFRFVLNEVLSLNAQELTLCHHLWPDATFLNEALSLNAQEF